MTRESAGAKLFVVVGAGLVAVGLLSARTRWQKPQPAVANATTLTQAGALPPSAEVKPAATERPAPPPAPVEPPSRTGPTAADRTAFLEAVEGGELATVKALHEKGVGVSGTLASAARSGNVEVLAYLLEQGLDVHEDEDVTTPPLLLADDHPKAAALLLAKGAKEVSVARAAAAGAPKAVSRVLAKGGSANDKSADDEPALHVALANVGGAKRRAIVADLVSHGALVDGDALTSALNTPPEERAVLIGALLGGKLTRDATARAIAHAAEHDDIDAIKKLATKGVAWSSLAGSASPLADAIVEADVPVVKALLDAGAPTGRISEDGDTALIAAVTAASGESEDAIRVVKALLDHGASASQRGREGRTPLFVASQQGSEVLVALLVSRGARVDDAVDGMTPLDAADMRGHEGVVKLLRARGAHRRHVDVED